VAELGLADEVIFTGPVPDEHLPAFYRGADVFAFTSLHEGFGIVLLEAMACGTPVVTSASSSLQEVAGDAALLVRDLLNPEEWADAIGQVVSDADLHTLLVQKGLERSRQYSWEKVGQQTLEAYRLALQS
jgi:glycosyltransferase involved in cell wall biosynthesis